jgi:hypothetical protein
VLYLVPPTYEASGSFVLLPPASTIESGGNPYLQLGGLNQVADILTRSMMAQSTSESVQQSHPTATYAVAPDPATSGPILVITAEDHTAGGAASTLSDVMALLPRQLGDLQEALGYTGEKQITSTVLAKDNQPKTIRKAQVRAIIAAVGAGLVLTGLVVALIDGLIERRHRTRAKGAQMAHGPQAPDDTTAFTAPKPHRGRASPGEGHDRSRSARSPATWAGSTRAAGATVSVPPAPAGQLDGSESVGSSADAEAAEPASYSGTRQS